MLSKPYVARAVAIFKSCKFYNLLYFLQLYQMLYFRGFWRFCKKLSCKFYNTCVKVIMNRYKIESWLKSYIDIQDGLVKINYYDGNEEHTTFVSNNNMYRYYTGIRKEDNINKLKKFHTITSEFQDANLFIFLSDKIIANPYVFGIKNIDPLHKKMFDNWMI